MYEAPLPMICFCSVLPTPPLQGRLGHFVDQCLGLGAQGFEFGMHRGHERVLLSMVPSVNWVRKQLRHFVVSS